MSVMILSAIVNSAILSIGLGAILWVIFRISGDRFWNASTRYAVWLAALVVTVALPAVYVAVELRQPQLEAVEAVPATPLTAPPAGAEPAAEAAAVATLSPVEEAASQPSLNTLPSVWIPSGPWTGWALMVWALGSAFMLGRLAVSYAWLSEKKARALPSPLNARARDWMRLCGSFRRIRVAVSEDLSIPVATGPLRPLILIPAQLTQVLENDEMEQVGLHEAAHLARWDDAALMFQRIVSAVLVLNPAVHWIGARLNVERELACDDIVVASTGRARGYARCLTRVAEIANGAPALSPAAPAVETRSVLERRLDMLLDKTRTPRPRLLKARLAAVLALPALGLAIAVTGLQPVAFTLPAELSAASFTLPAGSQRADARDSLARGIQAFDAGDFQTAADYFGQAQQQDPDFTLAKLYFATAYVAMYDPRAPETADYSFRAIRILEDVLATEPSNVDALVGLGLVYQRRNELRSARDFFLKATAAGPPNASVLYSIGALDWILVRSTANPLPLREQELLIDEGLQYLDKALAVDPQYGDAMTYKNLLLREKSRLASDPEAQKQLVAEADDWFSRALRVREANRGRTARAQTLPSIVGRAGAIVPPPPPPPPNPSERTLPGVPVPPGPPPSPTAPVRIGGDVARANLVSQVQPQYPALARAARVQDVVILETTIDASGNVADMKVVRGHPLLNEAAMDAVRQWRYNPQHLNGQPVSVVTTVTVNFSFRQ